MGIFKPRVQDAVRLVERIPESVPKAKFKIPFDLLSDVALSIQATVFHIQNLELQGIITDNTTERLQELKEEILEVKQYAAGASVETSPEPSLDPIPTFRQEVGLQHLVVMEVLDVLLAALNGTRQDIEKIPTTPPPVQQVHEECKLISAALTKLAAKEFKVDYPRIKKEGLENLAATNAKLLSIESKVMLMQAGINRLLQQKPPSVDLKPLEKTLSKISVEVKKVGETSDEVLGYSKVTFGGNIRLLIKDKKPRLIRYEGKGLGGVASYLKGLEEQNWHVQELLSLIEVSDEGEVAETWHGKALDGVPQLILKYAIQPTNGRRGKANYKVTIPHYSGAKIKAPPIPYIMKGNYYAIITLVDGTKCTTYCESQQEAGRFVNAALKLIPKNFHKRPLDYTIGVRTTVSRKRIKLVCRGAVYLAQGAKSPSAAWMVDF